MFYRVSSLNQSQTEKVTDADRSRGLEETIEILEAQIESLELELCYKNHELEEVQQELRYTNQEFCAVSNTEKLTLEQAEELAIRFLISEKPIKDALVELLTAIYKVPVKPHALAQVRKVGFTNRCGDIEVNNAA